MKRTLLLLVAITPLMVGCSMMPQNRVKLYHNPGNDTIATFPSELRGTYIRERKRPEEAKVIVILTDADGKIITDDQGKIQLVELTKNYFNPDFSICAEPPSDTAANASMEMTNTLSNQLAANAEAMAKLSNAVNALSVIQGGTDVDASGRIGITNDTSLQMRLNLSRQMIELQGRTQLVLLARDFMYRNCEAAANGYLSREDFLEMHKLSINQITAMSKASIKQAEAAEADAKASQTLADAQVRALNEKQASMNKCLGLAGDNFDKVTRCFELYGQ
ncbi:hypothetical protein ACXWTF_12140 [Thiomicrolovo sp. ZZH C-3]